MAIEYVKMAKSDKITTEILKIRVKPRKPGKKYLELCGCSVSFALMVLKNEILKSGQI